MVRTRWPTRRTAVRAILSLAAVALLLLVGGYVVLARTGPQALPAPSGTSRVGRVQEDWVDRSRTDPLAATPGQPRRLPIWIWYPAAVTAGTRPAPSVPAAWRNAQTGGPGRLSVNNLLTTLVKTGTPPSHAYAGAPVAASPEAFPVLLMQPGLGPAIPDYTAYAENLASHGYVVVGINEPGSSNLVVFADGTVARSTPEGSTPDNATAATDHAEANAIGRVWDDDAAFVLDTLQRVDDDPASPFYRRLDLSRVGLFGHSFGGATALAVCEQDARCRAGADLDGTPRADTPGQAVPRPFLFMSEAYPQGCANDANCRLLLQAYRQAGGPAYFVTIAGTKHFNYSDLGLQFNALGRFVLRRMGVLGAIAPERGLTIANAYLVAFFDRYVKGVDSPLPPAAGSFPEVQFSSRPRG